MSRCYPYPPPGYEKKATTELIADIVPAAQVSSKEKHRHRDKEKKKKRKRDDKDEKNSSHKEKRSSKNQKASATTPAHTNNDVGENGRLLQESSASKSSTGSGFAIKDPKDAIGGAAVQDAARRIPDRDSGWQEAKASETGKVGVSESRGGSHRSSDRSQAAAPAAPAPAAAAGGNSNSSAAVASTSKYVVSDKEINGKVPVVAVKPLDTGQQAESQQRHVQQQQQQHLEQQQKQQLQQQQQQQQLEQQQKQQQQQLEEQQKQQQQDRMKEEEKNKEEEKRREKERKRSPPSGEKERESKEKERENKERRHRFPEIKLAAIKEERLEEDEGYLEWLYHKRRRDPVDNRDGDDDDDDDDKKRGSFEQEVWAEAMFLPSVNMYALPYVVPN